MLCLSLNEIEFLLEVEPQLVPSHLSLVVGIDGIALTSNPTTHCWPILGYFSNIPYKYRSVFIIGVFLGLSKPKNCNEFLMQFVIELKELINTGIRLNDKYITVNLYALICDAPAKSFILNFKGHNGKNLVYAVCALENEKIAEHILVIKMFHYAYTPVLLHIQIVNFILVKL